MPRTALLLLLLLAGCSYRRADVSVHVVSITPPATADVRVSLLR